MRRSPHLLSRGTIREMTAGRSGGVDPTQGVLLRYGYGLELNTGAGTLGVPASAFGHRGSGGSTHVAWPGLGVGVSYVTNYLNDEDAQQAPDSRALRLPGAVHRHVSDYEGDAPARKWSLHNDRGCRPAT